MTADDARDRVTEMRDSLRRAMRALSLPKPDWAEAMRALGEANDMACSLWSDCVREEWRKNG